MVLSGTELSKKIKEQLKKEVRNCIQTYKHIPHLVVILVGDDPASQSYVKGKSKACDEVGIMNTTVRLQKDISEVELLRKIQEYNLRDDVDGILIQLPLPQHIDEHKVMNFIDPKKDVDGFHPFNIDGLYTGKTCIKPCTPTGIIKMLDYANVPIKGANAVVIGRSNIVGLPVAKMLLDRNATVTICHSKTQGLSEITKNADILIVAIGKPKFVTDDMVREGAVVIDVGVNRVDGKLCGDVDFDNIKDKATVITPVPGGVGPMTITCLLENTLKCFKNKFNDDNK
jgi:methylenetetrahydrofolate dehydrogenase (NADP+)/methenyltetrahydrofolate cyclohydrolase